MPKKSAKKIGKRATKKIAKKATSKKVSKVAKKGMSFDGLVDSVSRLHSEFLRQATKAINISLTLRNWLIGAYVHEFELRGADRAKYGDNLITELSRTLEEQDVTGCAVSNLYSHLNFFRLYPQIFQSLSGKLQSLGIEHVTEEQILQTLSGVFERANRVQAKSTTGKQNLSKNEIPRHSGNEIIAKLSYSHIVLLLGVDDPFKRFYYERECMRGNWSVRELKRQIGSLYFERTVLSTNKAKLWEYVRERAEIDEPNLVVRNPMVFEFLGLKPTEMMIEEKLEGRLLDKLQETLLEFGHGFCFEARQKRILIDDEYFFVDLLFYHRILRCHVLVELKTTGFKPDYLGQLNTYVSWAKENLMEPGDNPPIGILLCTGQKKSLVKYALAGMDNNLFVSRYMADLPTQEELLRIAQEEY